MSQSLADLFAADKAKHDMKSPLTTTTSPDELLSLGYPAAENMSDVMPPDDGKHTNSTTTKGANL